MRDLLSQDLKKATNDVMKIEILRRLERAEREICERKERVNEEEHKYEESLAELRKGGFVSLVT